MAAIKQAEDKNKSKAEAKTKTKNGEGEGQDGGQCPSCRSLVPRGSGITVVASRPSTPAGASPHWRGSAKLDLLVAKVLRLRALGDSADAAAMDPDDALHAARAYLGPEELGSLGLGREFRRPVKTVVVSQWAGMLDLAAQALRLRGVETARLALDAPRGQSQQAVRRFDEDSAVNVLLVCAPAGVGRSLDGLRLDSASVVIFCDFRMDSREEALVVDSVHRPGQSRPVHVFRLVSSDTVEEQLLAWRLQRPHGTTLVAQDLARIFASQS